MEKVICDVCGIAYPETAAQCPICGCARTENGQTSACDTVQVEEESTYTATKGGRFSKANVRKRLKAAQIQPVPLELPPRGPKVEEPEFDEDEDYDYDEEYDEDDDDDMPATNRGLIVVVVLLLLAIIAVASYIFIVQLDIFGSNDSKLPDKTPGASDVTTAPTDAPGVRIPCSGIELMDSEMTLGGTVLTMQLSFAIDPIDTTDDLIFTSSDPSVATVDKSGNVTAVGDGEATITITCGDISKTCKVTCVINGGDQPDVPDVPDEPEVPDEPMPDLQMRMTDASFSAKGYKWRAYKETEGFDASKFTWKVDDEKVATVDNGYVSTVAPGQTTLRVYYKGEEVGSCIIRCKWTETQVPDTPDTPITPVTDYLLKIDNSDPVYLYNNQPNSADVSVAVNGKFRLTIVDSDLEQIMNDVVWTISDESLCKIDGTTVTRLAKGGCTLTTEYKGVTYVVFIRDKA